MNKFYLIAVILGTIYITIASGCAVKTVKTENVNQEMGKSKKTPVLDKNSAKEENYDPLNQKNWLIFDHQNAL